MKSSTILYAIAAAASTAAHGIVTDLNIDGQWHSGYMVFQDPYKNPTPERVVWSFPDGGNGPVEDITSAAIACNKGATPSKLVAPVKAGGKVSFFWTTWPESHRGPTMTYMAKCGGSCASVDPTTLSFFKIDEAGINPGGTTWASDTLIANNNSWTVTIPSDITPGQYVIRHELLALHSAGTSGGAQFYPMCASLEVTGSGTANPEGVRFPGAYKAGDRGIVINIHQKLAGYDIPGPAVYRVGSGSGSGGTGTTVATSHKTSSSALVSVGSPTSTATTYSTAKNPTATTPGRGVPTTLATMTRPTTSAPTTTPTRNPQTTAASGCPSDPPTYKKCFGRAKGC